MIDKETLKFGGSLHNHTDYSNLRLRDSINRYDTLIDYAIELDNKQIDYEMEFLHIKYYDTQLNEYRCAIPDFYIPSRNEIVEIKSVYTLDIQNMKDKFKSYTDEDSRYLIQQLYSRIGSFIKNIASEFYNKTYPKI